jgi:ABC-type Mn2+/Zn2+ transport system permease subunit
MDLFAYSFFGSLVVGAVCPLIGVFFVLRRVVFLGIAVPQFAAAGVACGFTVLPWWYAIRGHPLECPGEIEGAFGFYLACALVFTLIALLILAVFSRKEGSPEGRIAAGYAFAAAVTVLFLSASALGASHVQTLLRGEILTLDRSDFIVISLFFGAVLVLFVLLRRSFILVGYDREAALSLGFSPFQWDLAFYVLVGASISVGVLTVGPLVIFGLMVIPPLAARMLAWNMPSFYLLASGVGILTAFTGFLTSYSLDWPLGPTDVVVAFALMILIGIARLAARMISKVS